MSTNRATPADPAIPETDAEWLRRNVFEITGVECTVSEPDHDGDVFLRNPQLLVICYELRKHGRSVNALLAGFMRRGWPLLSSPASTPAPKAEPPAQPVAGEPKRCQCAECGAPTSAFQCELCERCYGRRHGLSVVARQTKRCAELGDACPCVYCVLRTSPKYDDAAVAMRTAALPEQAAATHRLAALDRRERPRENPAEKKMLALPHPWSNADEWEP